METASSKFDLERVCRKAILTISREDRLNALDAQTFGDLLAALEGIEVDSEIALLIIHRNSRAARQFGEEAPRLLQFQ